MHQQLSYIINWNKRDKTKTWSGTGYSIYKALRKYFNISVIDIPADSFCKRCYRKIFRSKNFTFTSKDILWRRSILNIKCKNKIVFQFTEFVNTPSAKTYIYQDLNVEHLLMLSKTNKDLFHYAVGSNNNISFLESRCKLQNEYYKSTSGIFCMGKWLYDYIVKECNISSDKVVHVGGGVNIDIKKIKPSNSKTKSKILFIGRDFRRKGGFITIEAFKILKQHISNAELFIAGPDKKTINEEIEGVHFLGDLDTEELTKYFNECDIFCMPSYFEAYGLVFIEALVSGLPCIGRNCYEMPYFIEDGKTGLLLKNDSHEELAMLMLELLSNDKYYKNVLEKKDWYIEEYSWDTVAKRMYKHIANSGACK